MLFMVIERFRDNDMIPVYEKLRDAGRMLPEGLRYVDSWVEPNFSRCFQLMECDDLRQLPGVGAPVERPRRRHRDRAGRDQRGDARGRRAAPRRVALPERANCLRDG